MSLRDQQNYWKPAKPVHEIPAITLYPFDNRPPDKKLQISAIFFGFWQPHERRERNAPYVVSSLLVRGMASLLSGGMRFRAYPPLGVILIALLVFYPRAPAFADVQHIYLLDGRVISGRVVSQSAEKVWVRTGRRVLVLRKNNIRRIAYDTPLEKEHLSELRKQRAQAGRLFERRLHDELERSRAAWEKERRQESEAQGKVARRQLETEAQKLRRGNLWRSIVYPGWGQYHRGEVRKGYVFGGLFLGAALLWYRADREFIVAERNFNQVSLNLSVLVAAQPNTASIVGSVALAQAASDTKRVAATNAQVLQTAAVGLYFVSAVDALLFQGRTPRPASASTMHPRVFVAAGPNGYTAGIAMRF